MLPCLFYIYLPSNSIYTFSNQLLPSRCYPQVLLAAYSMSIAMFAMVFNVHNKSLEQCVCVCVYLNKYLSGHA